MQSPASIHPAPPKKKRLLTHSRGKSFRACHYRHYLAYELRYRARKQSEALVIGDMFHRHCCEIYWLARKEGASLEEATERAINAMRDACATAITTYRITAFVSAKLMAMTISYTSRWNMRPGIEVLAVEVEFKAPLVFGKRTSDFWDMGGKIDAIIRLEDGRIALMEHKTSSADVGIGSAYRRRLALDEQLSIYYEAAAWLGYPVETIIYDICKKPKQAPYTATPPEKREYTQMSDRACKECKRSPKYRACKLCKKKSSGPAPHLDPELGVHCKNGKVETDPGPGPAPHIDPEIGVACVDGRVVTDPGGRLYANMRERDETSDEYLLRLLKDAQEEPLVETIELQRTENQRKQFALIFKGTAASMRWHIENNIHDRNSDACFHNGGAPCDFIEVCEGTARLEDTNLFIQMEDAHAELSIGDEV